MRLSRALRLRSRNRRHTPCRTSYLSLPGVHHRRAGPPSSSCTARASPPRRPCPWWRCRARRSTQAGIHRRCPSSFCHRKSPCGLSSTMTMWPPVCASHGNAGVLARAACLDFRARLADGPVSFDLVLPAINPCAMWCPRRHRCSDQALLSRAVTRHQVRRAHVNLRECLRIAANSR
jgi:hypothetical protein